MPKLILPLPETELSVLRPTVMSVTRPLFKLLGIPGATRIFYPTEGDDKDAQAGSLLGSDDVNEPNFLPFGNKIVIAVRETPNPDRLSATAIHRPENFPVFRDDALSTIIKPAYSDTEVTLDFKYRAADRQLADRMRDEVRMRYSDLREVFEFHAVFNWQIPHAYMEILRKLHELREKVEPYGENFNTYFTGHTDARMSLLSNQSGTFTQWAVSEQQGQVLGYFDFQGVMDQATKEDDGDTWSTSFSFKFRFEKPLAVIMHYPIIVHNQIVPQAYRPSPKDDRNKPPARSMSMSTDAMWQFRGGRTLPKFQGQNGYAYPEFDEFIPGSVVSDTNRVITALIRVGDDKKELLNLGQIGNFKFKQVILDFMVKESAYMDRAYASVFCVSLYNGIDLTSDVCLNVDSALNVRSLTDRSLREENRVRLSLVTNWSFLTPRAIESLRNNGEATIEIIKVIDPTCPIPVLMPNGGISRGDMQDVKDHLSNNTNSPPGSPPGLSGIYKGDPIIFSTVGTLFIETFKE